MEKEYTKLSNLVNEAFTINQFFGYKWKKWDNENKKMLVADRWEKDYRKSYLVETDKGLLDLSSNQVGILLETVCRKGQADLIGKTFQVKSNGKTGMDIRYFFNEVMAVKPEPVPEKPTVEPDFVPDEINLDDIPF